MSGIESPHDDAPPAVETRPRSGAESLREARVHVPHRGLRETTAAAVLSGLRAAGLRRATTVSCDGQRTVLQVETDHPLAVAELPASPAVCHVQSVNGARDRATAILELEAPDFPTSVAARADDIVGTPDATLAERGLTLTLVGRQAAIGDVVRQYESAGMAPELERIGAYAAERDGLAALTDRQREVLRTAYRRGYFEVPRAASAEDIAAELDIGPSTVVEHLRRAERNLLRRQLGDPVG